MAKNPTNKDLSQDLDDVKQEIKDMKTDVRKLLDWMLVEQALKTSIRDKNGKIDWNKAIERVFTFLIALAGCLYLLIEFVVKGSK